MIYGQQSGQQTGSVWSIALSAAMGNGIVPRSTEEHPVPSAARWPFSGTRRAHRASVAPRRA